MSQTPVLQVSLNPNHFECIEQPLTAEFSSQIPSPLSTQAGDDVEEIMQPTSTSMETDDISNRLKCEEYIAREREEIQIQEDNAQSEGELLHNTAGVMDANNVVMFYASSISQMEPILDNLPSFARGKTLVWKRRANNTNIDAVFVLNTNNDQQKLFNYRLNEATRNWQSMHDFGGLTFIDADELILHAQSWPIPIGLSRDYTLKIGRKKTLFRVLG